MQTFLKSCFSLVVAGLLMVSLHAGAAGPSKDKNKDDPVKKCQAECLGIKDTAAYEGCMLKCKETNATSTPALPTIKK